jgi:hypothetical protein
MLVFIYVNRRANHIGVHVYVRKYLCVCGLYILSY